jgi:predicted RNA-binding Zn-ribbon protein involved in translation (DUF1610 family)
MVKIIKMGTRRTKECTTCGCYFSFDEEDTKCMTNDSFKGVSKFIPCPQCGKNVVLEATR